MISLSLSLSHKEDPSFVVCFDAYQFCLIFREIGWGIGRGWPAFWILFCGLPDPLWGGLTRWVPMEFNLPPPPSLQACSKHEKLWDL